MSAVLRRNYPATGLPSKDASIEELAEYWAAHDQEIREMDSWAYAVKRRLMEAVRDAGPVQTSLGKLAIEPTSYEYPEEIVAEFPTLGRHTVTATVDTLGQAERLLDLVTEQDPAAEVAHSMKVDGRLANSWLKTAEPAAAMRLMTLRKPRGKLVLH